MKKSRLSSGQFLLKGLVSTALMRSLPGVIKPMRRRGWTWNEHT